MPDPATTASNPSVFLTEVLPMEAYTLIGMLLIGLLLIAAFWLGGGTRSEGKTIPYESGMIPSGSARLAYPVPFYLVAIFFIVFDVESVFIFSWAIAWDSLGLPGLIHITFFIVVLLLGLVWLLIKKGLEWGPSAERRGP